MDLKFRQEFTSDWSLRHELVVTKPDGTEIRSGPDATDQIVYVYDDQIEGLPFTDQSPRSGYAMTTHYYQGSLPMLMRFEVVATPVTVADLSGKDVPPNIDEVSAEHIVTHGPPYNGPKIPEWEEDEVTGEE